MSTRIGIFDSGVGGLSVLRELRKALPGADFIYYSDNAWCPYGDKPAETIIGRCRAITELLLSKGAQLIVVACNTATSAAIATLRKEYADIPFVGMEPAVKPAALQTKSGVIGVLATAGTLKGSKYLKNKSIYEDDVQIIEHVGRGFVELVESGKLEGPEAEAVCKASLDPLIEQGADRIVLGCTHYPFLLPVLRKVCPDENVQFIDPAPAVARRVQQLLGIDPEEKDLAPEIKTTPGTVELLSSGPGDALERTYALICRS